MHGHAGRRPRPLRFQNRLDLALDEGAAGRPATTFGSRDVLDYIYAVMNSPTYRVRYASHLIIDFPRVPLTSNRALFREMCRLGVSRVKICLRAIYHRFASAGEEP